ncbi:MAG: hypothetical protein ACKOHK_11275 [Planctomycetia bacterium]
MRHLCLTLLAFSLGTFGLVACIAAAQAANCDCRRQTCTGCTDEAACLPCEPACKASWEEKKTKKPKYSMKCEYACGRAAECFCTDPAECRSCPPCGHVYTKKKLYKADGEEKVEKVPKYEVQMVPATPCDCASCSGVCWWNPLSVLHYLAGH